MANELVQDVAQLQASNLARLNRLAAQGMQVQGLSDHFNSECLAELLGDRIEHVKKRHELWLAAQLDAIEAQAQRVKLTAPAPFPIHRSKP